MRLFIAADLPDTIRVALAAEHRRIGSALAESGSSLKWVKPEQAHLTLVFIGNVDDARVPAVVEAIRADIDAPPIDAVFEGAGVFPPRGAPRVLWIGVGAGAGELVDLQRVLASRIAALGLPLEDRAFHPHLTLARWRESRPADRDRALAAAPRGVVGRARIDGATLYQSRLSPAGPSYTALARATLTGHQV
ncbi:MAG TPA: RNA 2',3'-cyclic phosphodiesterase [Vicinamibacterales bacterium]|nr:RNA 2',3'-cyclic phosphodiesterase [Vicinamibacterales bacterium]